MAQTTFIPRPVKDDLQHANNQDLQIIIQTLKNQVAQLEAEVKTLKGSK